MSKEETAAYNKAYKEANKEKVKAYGKAYYRANKKALAEKRWVYEAKNKEVISAKAKIYNKQLNESEGIGVYKAIYPSGIYIGSGQIRNRRQNHLLGNSRIAKTLKEKSTSFEVICLTNDINDARVKEKETIDLYGLANLLNTKAQN